MHPENKVEQLDLEEVVDGLESCVDRIYTVVDIRDRVSMALRTGRESELILAISETIARAIELGNFVLTDTGLDAVDNSYVKGYLDSFGVLTKVRLGLDQKSVFELSDRINDLFRIVFKDF